MKYFKLIILFILFFNYNLLSQEDSLKNIFDYSLEELMNVEVSGVSRFSQNISDVPNSVEVITQQQIRDRGYYDLSDLLKDIQGIDYTDNAARFGEFYSIRGISGNDRFLILINGQKINPASGTFISVGNSISIRFALRVEIIYGPASAIYGADAFSGIINIVFKDDAPEKKNINLSAYSKYGNMNTLDIAFNSSGRLTKNLSFNLSARNYSSDGFDIIGTDSIYNVLNDYSLPLNDEVGQTISDNNIYLNINYKNFSLNYYHQQFNEGNAYGFDPQFYIYSKENKWEMSTDLVWATYKKKFKNKGNITFTTSYKNHTQDNNTIFYKWIIPGVFTDNFHQYMTGIDNTFLSLLTYNQLINTKLQFIVGVDNEYTVSIPPYANDEVLELPLKFEGENAKLIAQQLTIRENRSSGFGQFNYSPLKFIQFIVGARYDYSTRYKGVFNPRIGIIISPFRYTKINFIYGNAFQSTSLFYQYEQFGNQSLAMISAVDIKKTDSTWTLKNQNISSKEISISQKLFKIFDLNFDFYYNDLTNLIVRNLFVNYPNDSVYNKYFDKYTSGVRNENIGREKIFGSDFALKTNISRNFNFYFYYSWTNGISFDLNNIETKIPRISTNKIWIGFTKQNLFKYVTISSRLRWVSEMYNQNIHVFPNNIQPGYWTIDLNLAVNNLFKFMRIYANFNNLLNQKYSAAGLYRQEDVYTAVIPQLGFNFNAGIEFFFNK